MTTPNETEMTLSTVKRGRTIGQRAWDDSDGTFQDATDIAERLFTGDPDAMRELLPAIVREHCRGMVAQYVASIRKAAFYPGIAVAAQGGRLRAAQASVALMDFPLPNTGKLLRDATGDECAVAAAGYLVTAADAGAKARWLEAIAERAGESAVGDVLTEAQLQQIRKTINAQ